MKIMLIVCGISLLTSILSIVYIIVVMNRKKTLSGHVLIVFLLLTISLTVFSISCWVLENLIHFNFMLWLNSLFK